MATDLMTRTGLGALPVVWNDTLVGLLTERDARRAGPSIVPALGRYDFVDSVKLLLVKEVMTRPAPTVTPETPLADTARLLAAARLQALPVVDDGLLVGLVTVGDLRAHLIARLEHESPSRLREVLAVVTLATSDAATLALARSLTEGGRANLTVLHVLPPLVRFTGHLLSNARRTIAHRRERSALECVRHVVGPDGGPTIRSRVATGDLVTEVSKAAAQVEGEVIVVGRPRERKSAGGLDEATIEQMIRRAPCPVLVVPS